MTDAAQDQAVLEKDRGYFAGNDDDKNVQRELAHDRFIALSAAESVAQARNLLDFGNGGILVFPIEHISRVTAVDVFVEKDSANRYPRVRWPDPAGIRAGPLHDFSLRHSLCPLPAEPQSVKVFVAGAAELSFSRPLDRDDRLPAAFRVRVPVAATTGARGDWTGHQPDLGRATPVAVPSIEP
jgi:hypothetical protein